MDNVLCHAWVDARGPEWTPPTASVTRLDDGRQLDPSDPTGGTWLASPVPLRWLATRTTTWASPLPGDARRLGWVWAWCWPTPELAWPTGLDVVVIVHGPPVWGLEPLGWEGRTIYRAAPAIVAPVPPPPAPVPTRPTCGARTAAGGSCSRVVASVGLRCYQH